jgi:hypothetical protein
MYKGDAETLQEAVQMLQFAGRIVYSANILDSEKDIIKKLHEARSLISAADVRIRDYMFPRPKDLGFRTPPVCDKHPLHSLPCPICQKESER